MLKDMVEEMCCAIDTNPDLRLWFEVNWVFFDFTELKVNEESYCITPS